MSRPNLSNLSSDNVLGNSLAQDSISQVNMRLILDLVRTTVDSHPTWKGVCDSIFEYVRVFHPDQYSTGIIFLLLFYGDLPEEKWLQAAAYLQGLTEFHSELSGSEWNKIRSVILNEVLVLAKNKRLPGKDTRLSLFLLNILAVHKGKLSSLNRQDRSQFNNILNFYSSSRLPQIRELVKELRNV